MLLHKPERPIRVRRPPDPHQRPAVPRRWRTRRSTGWTAARGDRLYALTPLQFEPGSKWKYSNAGINTAGRIIEVVSGMPYEKFLKNGCSTRWR